MSSLIDIKPAVNEAVIARGPRLPAAAVASQAAPEPEPNTTVVSPKSAEPPKPLEQTPAALESEAPAEPEKAPYMPPPAPEPKPEQAPPARQELSPAEPEPAPYVRPPAPTPKPEQMPVPAATAQGDEPQSTPVFPAPSNSPEPEPSSIPVTPGIQRVEQAATTMAETRPHQEAPPVEQRPAPSHAPAARHEELPPWLRPQPEAKQDDTGISPQKEVSDQQSSRPLSARLRRPAPPKEKEPAPTGSQALGFARAFQKNAGSQPASDQGNELRLPLGTGGG